MYTNLEGLGYRTIARLYEMDLVRGSHHDLSIKPSKVGPANTTSVWSRKCFNGPECAKHIFSFEELFVFPSCKVNRCNLGVLYTNPTLLRGGVRTVLSNSLRLWNNRIYLFNLLVLCTSSDCWTELKYKLLFFCF